VLVAQRPKVAVVGLGIMGSATLYALAARGVEAIGFEQFSPGHDRGSSHGESRVFRSAYFEHPSYVPLARAALRSWRVIEASAGAELLTLTGIIEAGHAESEIVRGTLQASREHGLAHELIDAKEIRRRFPALHVPDGYVGVAQPEAGFLRAEAAGTVLLDLAARHGAGIDSGRRVAAIESRADGIRLCFDDGEVAESDGVVVATGAWIARLVPALAPVLTVTRQTLGWFSPARPDLVAVGRLPVFIVDGAADTIYGFPDLAGTGVKIASHRKGAIVPDADGPLLVDPADTARLSASVARYLPDAVGPITRAAACLYTSTPDEHFLIDRHPDDPRIVLASPCSGHGFKFASVIGEVLSDLALGRDTPHDISRFAGARLGLSGDRR
jgi:sarcosine oxidase